MESSPETTLNKIIESYHDHIIGCLQEMVRIRSVEDRPGVGKPFGEGVDRALERALEIGKQLGFSVKNIDHYAGHIEMGRGEETIGVLVHLDVVPEGEGWAYPPFGAEIHDGKIYGRGAVDNKGSFAACLYAMKAIEASGLPLGKKIRMILGTNEETRCEGIAYYLEKESAPDLSIVPDGDFPVLVGEKGILSLELKKSFKETQITSSVVRNIEGGNALNAVPDLCSATLVNTNSLEKKIRAHMTRTGEPNTLEINGKELVLDVKGKASHAYMPEKGINAISRTIALLAQICPADDGCQDFFKWYNDSIGMAHDGRGLGCAMEDDVSGELTLNVGTITLNEDSVTLGVDIRYPLSEDVNSVKNRLAETLKDTGVTTEVTNELAPIHFPEDHFLIQTVLDVYRRETGDYDSKPLVIGGGTYARALSNAVAFGPEFPGRTSVAHQKDEYISIADLIKCARIYTQCLYRLAR